jgi:hypothetical protein
MYKPLYVGYCGFAGVGKDTVAAAVMKRLSNEYTIGSRKYSFADPLKEFVGYVFDIPKVWLYDQDLKKKHVYVTFNEHSLYRMERWVKRNIEDKGHWEWLIGKPELSSRKYFKEYRYQEVAQYLFDQANLICENIRSGNGYYKTKGGPIRYRVSVRKLLQHMGTELIRKQLDDQFWAEDKDVGLGGDVVMVPDVRFDTEIDFIKNAGGEFVNVVNPEYVPSKEVLSHESEKLAANIPKYLGEYSYYVYENRPSEGINEKNINALAQFIADVYKSKK